jgi:hypothetical protein
MAIGGKAANPLLSGGRHWVGRYLYDLSFNLNSFYALPCILVFVAPFPFRDPAAVIICPSQINDMTPLQKYKMSLNPINASRSSDIEVLPVTPA